MIANVDYKRSDTCRKLLERMPSVEFKDGEVAPEKITMMLESGSVIHFVGSVGEEVEGQPWESSNEHI